MVLQALPGILKGVATKVGASKAASSAFTMKDWLASNERRKLADKYGLDKITSIEKGEMLDEMKNAKAASAANANDSFELMQNQVANASQMVAYMLEKLKS